MATNKLRGASRRDFIKGAFAVGAALGWGPARTWDFITRAGGDAMADCTTKGIQNVVFFVGGGGAHGYPSLFFPHPDMFYPAMGGQEGRVTGTTFSNSSYQGDLVSAHFMQDANNGGDSTQNNSFPLRNGLANGVNYTNPAAENHPLRGNWAAGERYKFFYGVDNQAFRGYQSPNSRSAAIDQRFWGASKIPGNKRVGDAGADAVLAKNFVVQTRETPWLTKYGLKKAITAIDGGGINTFHVTGAHNHFIQRANRRSVFAAAATIQLVRPTIVPVILVGEMNDVDDPGITGLATTDQFYGSASIGNHFGGQPAPAIVANADGMVNLFNSNAAKAGGALQDPKNALLYEAYTKGMIGNSKTAKLPTFSRGYRTAKLGSNLVGLNLADLLRPTDADRLRYGYTGSGDARFTELRDNMIVAAKALRLGLTSQLVIRYFNDDPHSSFSNGGQGGGANAATVALAFSNFLNAFMEDLMEVPDPFCPGIKLGDNTVIAFVGDTPRTGVNLNAWNDPTGGSQNRTWVMSNGILRTGFFGGDRPRFKGENSGVTNDHNSPGPGEGGMWDPKTGDMINFDANQDSRRFRYGEYAMAAVLYAITRGDDRRVNDFYNGNVKDDIPAVLVPVLL